MIFVQVVFAFVIVKDGEEKWQMQFSHPDHVIVWTLPVPGPTPRAEAYVPDFDVSWSQKLGENTHILQASCIPPLHPVSARQRLMQHPAAWFVPRPHRRQPPAMTRHHAWLQAIQDRHLLHQSACGFPATGNHGLS
jgi:hypothetical protein